MEISFFKCPLCGSEATIKDTDRFSSLMCSCRIIIYYYDNAIDLEISKEDYLDYKQKKGGYHFKEKKQEET